MPRMFVSIPDIIQCLYLITLPTMAIIGFIYCVCSFITASKWIAVGAIILSWLLLIGIGLILKGLLLFLFKKCPVGELAQCKISLLMGWGGSLAFGWAPRVLVFFVYGLGKDYYLELLWYIVFVSLGGISLLWALFVTEYKKKCQVVYQKTDKLPWILFVVNCLVLLATVKLGLINFFTDPIVKTQLGLSIICAACSIELGQILCGKVKLHEEEMSENPSNLENGGLEPINVRGSEVESLLQSEISQKEMWSDLTQRLREADPTNIVLFIYIFSFLFTILYGSYRVFFGDPVTPEEHIFGQSVVLSWMVIVVFMIILRAIVRYYHQKKNLNKLEQCRNFMLITLGGFAVFGFVPRIMAPFCSGSNFKLVSLLFFFICAISTIEFLHVLQGKIEMTDEDEDEELEWLLVPQASRFKCNMCHKKFNRTARIPRILKECGHTICEECGNKLWNESTGTLQCPFCLIVTFNKGPANLLPTNFAVMGTVQLNSFQNLIDV
ncbi:hypothetical protein CAEBREN_16055 [Caenorhabditis brenneri]|uniref:RING-type domain-containing protein n=1 Tax=Caenorhabditis brenneri TaxID=135651 RepID=G0N818_CAEBE|nr:hypothetical protein CAEBREN_16055 [Caenorhabditis brenneri]